MPAYRDNRTDRWRYRKWITKPDGLRERLTGTPATDTKKAAEHAEAMHVLRVMNPGMVPAAAAPATTDERKEMPTIEEFSVRFLLGYLPAQKPSERASKEQILAGQLLPFFGHLRLDEIRQEDIDAFATAQLNSGGRSGKGCTVKTLNNRLGVLSSLLIYAHENRLIPKPTFRLHVGGMSPEIVAVPAADVRKLLGAATDARYRVAILLASEAGLRIGEIRALQWVDLEARGQLTVRRAVDPRGNVGAPKHDKRRTVPLSEALASALAALRRRGLWVVGTLDGGLLGYAGAREALLAVYVKAGVAVPKSPTGVTMPWHSLRHSYGTELAGGGVPLPTIRDLMGHASITTTMRYVTVTDEQKRGAIARVFGQQVGNSSDERPQHLKN